VKVEKCFFFLLLWQNVKKIIVKFVKHEKKENYGSGCSKVVLKNKGKFIIFVGRVCKILFTGLLKQRLQIYIGMKNNFFSTQTKDGNSCNKSESVVFRCHIQVVNWSQTTPSGIEIEVKRFLNELITSVVFNLL